MNDNQSEHTILDIVSRYLDPATTMVFLFGSRATGSADTIADYDVGLFAGEPIDGAAMMQIKEDLDESSVPVPVDIVDFARVDEEFRQVALKNIVIWNRPNNGTGIS